MSFVPQVAYCPYRANIDYSTVQFADFSNVRYFEPSDSEEEDELDDERNCEYYYTLFTQPRYVAS